MSSFQSGVRFLALPNPQQAATLRRWIGCQRHIFNAKVEEDRLFVAQRRMMLREDADAVIRTPLDRLYAQFKDDHLTPWLSDVPSQVLREGTYRWFNTKQRQLKGLAKAPRKRSQRDFNSVMLCSDLFEFTEDGRLILGTAKFPVGRLHFNAHRPFGHPKMITLRESAGRWFVSFSYEQSVDTVENAGKDSQLLREPHELAYELGLLGEKEVAALTLGIDRNVADNCVATSRGDFFLPEAVMLERIARKARGAKRQQKRLARTKKGSANRRKAAARVARKYGYKAEVLRDFAHKTSLALSDSGAKLIVFEDLKIQNMTRRPKAKQDNSGRWLRNGRAAKAGLNRSILSSAWGRIRVMTQYKAARRNVLVGFVRPHHSSQECSLCGHTHPENRHGAAFLCQRCGYAQHADLNAATNIAARGVTLLRSGELETPPKAKKRVAVKRRTNSGSVRPGVSVEHLQDAASGLAPGTPRTML
ncbi:RNA-guided endonuclease InsQ/TnpB family protein [Polaromonas naphthalenivorans]|uniref:Transposase n=1 Tax=Polaromonas naphthalenivorans (strain CJ2) TaxID=365044 RepID=A1VS43_POLNA|nr:RNA-guided endonuclease TnpB family protein [Polaromonas naphthalenivorans]ABM38471.1 transposase [Polaromonas naphthalenivorans CJ2]